MICVAAGALFLIGIGFVFDIVVDAAWENSWDSFECRLDSSHVWRAEVLLRETPRAEHDVCFVCVTVAHVFICIEVVVVVVVDGKASAAKRFACSAARRPEP